MRRNSYCSNCVHQSDLLLVLQGRVGAHKLGVVGNTIYVLLQISSGMLLPKIMKIGSRIKKLLQKWKGYSFFETQCILYQLCLYWHVTTVDRFGTRCHMTLPMCRYYEKCFHNCDYCEIFCFVKVTVINIPLFYSPKSH